MGTAPLLGLLLLVSIEAALPSYSDALSSAQQVCEIEIKLRDGYSDGWNGNSFQLRTGPVAAIYAVPLTPLTQLCATLNNSAGEPTFGTLLDNDYCAFKAQIPAGWNLDFDFSWKYEAWPDENYITIQLSYVQPFFGPVIIGNSHFVNATDSNGYKCQVPYLDPVFALSCGPAPSPVSAVTATPGGSGSIETIITWTPVIVANNSIAFSVQVDDPTADNDTRQLGVYTGSSVNVLLNENTNYIVSVKALNKYGESAPATYTFRTGSYVTADLQLILFASRPYAWLPDGKVAVFVNNAISVISSIDTDDSQIIVPICYRADGQNHIVSLHYIPPTGSAGETSFRVIRQENGVELFNSGQTVHGPQYWDATFNVSHAAPNRTCNVCCLGSGKCSSADPDGYCCDVGEVCCRTGSTNYRPFTCCQGAQKCLTNYTGAQPSSKSCSVPVSTCPDAAPSSGAPCYGVLSCSYNSSCCCPGDPQDEVCGPTVKYQCTGESGATWTQANLSLHCQSDAAFSCPSTCPTTEPPCDVMCMGSRTCLYAKSCCCPDEPDPSNQICTFQHQLKCSGTYGGRWSLTTVVPSQCPALCYSQTKAGTCPSVTGSSTPTQNLCQVDANCNGTLKCCDGSYGKSCVQPCDCSVTPTCQPWEKVVFTEGPGCCGGTKTCATDPSSTQCPTTAPSWDGLQCILPQDQKCGAGVKTRTVNVRDSTKGCVTSTETQPCNIPCPVNCVGQWGPCGTCSSNCKGGTCTRVYKITTSAQYGGKACNYSDGAISTPEACSNLPACPVLCPLKVVVKDFYGDGWTYSTPKGYVNFYDNETNALLLSQWIDKTKINSTNLAVKSGTVLKINYTPDKYAYEDIILIASNENGVQGASLYQDPMDLTKWGVKGGAVPKNISYFSVKCNDCSLVTPQWCLNVYHRQPCGMFNDHPSTCGVCASGYKQGTNASGPCVDTDECAMANNPCTNVGASCKNLEGTFQCICPNGTYWMYGYCEKPGVCPPQRFRMEWFDMTPKQRQLYLDGWQCLFDADLYSELWTYHSSGATGTDYPSPFFFGHSHGSGFFYWHRTFSLKFEDMVRQCSIMLNRPQLRCFVGAYWDSASMLLAANNDVDRIDYMRSAFFTDEKDPDGYNIGIGKRTDKYDATHPFNYLAGSYPPDYWQRGADSNSSALWPGSDVQWGVISTSTTMQSLLGLVTPHFAMHPYVGGAFGGVESARDPLFFLHHNYYDMLWEMWKICRGKTTWASSSLSETWFANDRSKDYSPDGPIPGFPAYPVDVYDNMNLLVRQSDGSTRNTAVVYSSSSYSRASGSGVITCPNALGQYFKASIPTTAVTNAIGLAQKRSFVESGGRLGPKTRKSVAVEVPPPHLWHVGNRDLHPEHYSEWREHLRRLAGGGHTADDRHVNILAHTWRSRKSYLGRALWLQTVHQDQPTMTKDIGQQCRELIKTLLEDDTVKKGDAFLAGLDCECEKTNGNAQGALPPETVRAFKIASLCQYDGCRVSPCAFYTSLVHGRPEDNGVNDPSYISTGAQTVINRLNLRIQGN